MTNLQLHHLPHRQGFKKICFYLIGVEVKWGDSVISVDTYKKQGTGHLLKALFFFFKLNFPLSPFFYPFISVKYQSIFKMLLTVAYFSQWLRLKFSNFLRSYKKLGGPHILGFIFKIDLIHSKHLGSQLRKPIFKIAQGVGLCGYLKFHHKCYCRKILKIIWFSKHSR